VHPLAGQGVNLGFGDAAALAEVIKSAHAGADPGDVAVLRRFERARAEDILAMRTATDGLARLFRTGASGVRRLRNLGMNSVDRLPVLKSLLVAHALGPR
jgi:2-octaprenylphenol hydroxylase